VDDVAWWAGGKTEEEVAHSLEKAAEASLTWAASNGIAFDQDKTEAALFRRKQSPPTAQVRVGNKAVPFNKEATRWLGISR